MARKQTSQTRMVKAVRAKCDCGETTLIHYALRYSKPICSTCDKIMSVNRDEIIFVESYVLDKKQNFVSDTQVEEVSEVKVKNLKQVDEIMEGKYYYWVSDNFKEPKLVKLASVIDENFCEVEFNGNLYKTLIRKLREEV